MLRSGAPWRDLPIAFGPYTTCYNRFVRWRRAGVWSQIIDALGAAHDAAVREALASERHGDVARCYRDIKDGTGHLLFTIPFA